MAILALTLLCPSFMAAENQKSDLSRNDFIGLSTAEQIAIKNNYELRALRMEGRLKEITINERLREFFPSLSVSYRRNRTIARRDFDNGQHSLQLSLSQPIYDGGRTLLAHEIARIDRRLARLGYYTALDNLRFKVRQAYLELQQQRANISVALAGRLSTENLLRKAEVERRLGDITELDLREIKNELGQRQLTYKNANDNYQDSLREFGILLGVPETQSVTTVPLDLYRLKIRDLLLSESALFRQALKSHEKLRESKINLARNRREYLITKYDYLPSIALTGHYGKTGDEWPPANTEWGMGISFTFKFLGNTLSNDLTSNRTHNGSNRGYTAGGQLNIFNDAGWQKPHLTNTIALMRARYRRKELIRQVRLDVRKLRRNLLDKKKELQLADEELAIRERRFLIELFRYHNGDLSVNKLFEEELLLIQARLNLIRQRKESALAVSQLEIGLGLRLDSLGLLNLDRIEQIRPDDDVYRRAWKPKTTIKAPPENPQKNPGRNDSQSPVL